MRGNNDRFDQNLKRMLHSALDQPRPSFQERLVRDVLDELARQRQVENAAPSSSNASSSSPSADEESRARSRMRTKDASSRAWWAGVVESIRAWARPMALAGAAAVLLAAATLWLATASASRTIGRVNCLYGLVALEDHGASQTVADTADLKSGQRVQTRSGSKAQILLPDKSKLLPEPRTSLQIAGSRQGPRILLEQGALQLDAAKQPLGRAIYIEAARAQIKVLGTRLEVRLVNRPSGTQQTRVRVLSGQVEMESAGRKVLLPRGTEGVADAGQPPVRSSVVFEVNELLGLFNQTQSLAAQSGRRYGLPAIFDLTTGAIWTMVPAQRLQPAGPRAFSLKLKYPAFRVTAYTLDGAEVTASGSGQILRLDFSTMPASQPSDFLILKVPGVGGLLKETAAGLNECSLPGADTDSPALLQFHLPDSARLEQLTPAAVRTTRELDRLIVTVAAAVRLPEVCE